MKKWFFFLAVFYSFFQLECYDFNWSTTQTLSSLGEDAEDPQIAIDSNGNATVIWIENGVIQTNFQPTGGSWNASPEPLSDSGSSSPRIAVDGSGNVTAVWIEEGLIQTAILPLNGAWGEVTTLSEAGAATPQVAVDSAGNTIVIWERNGFIESTTLSEGVWSLVSMLSSANSDFPKIAISEYGNAVAVWHTSSNPGGLSSIEAIYGSTCTVGGSWQTAKMLTSNNVNAVYPDVTIDGNGNATAVWFQYEKPVTAYTDVQIFASQLQNNEANWGSGEAISDLGFRNPADLSLHVKSDANGNIIALWNMSTDGTVFSVQANMKQIGRGWGGFANLVGESFFAVSADVAVSPMGQALMACMFSEQFNSSTITIFTDDTYIAGYANNFWSAPQTVSAGDRNGYPRVSASSDNQQIYGAVAWLSSDGTHNQLQVVTGTKQVLDPPSNLMLTQETNSFGVYTDYSNVLSWDPSPAPGVSSYVIYRNGVYFTRVESGTQLIDHNNEAGGAVTYGVAALDIYQSQSETITISFP